jgi:hypothetical protein
MGLPLEELPPLRRVASISVHVHCILILSDYGGLVYFSSCYLPVLN